MKKTVVYISSCALNAEGKPDPFFLQELPWLRKRFDRVVLCANSGVAEITEDRPERIAVTRPAHGALRACLQAPFHRLFREELRHLRADGRLNMPTALKLLIFNVRGLRMRNWIQAVLRGGERTTLYAYWLSFDGFAAALCKWKNPGFRAIARAHAFDIDVRRNPMNPYLMKRFMARTLDSIYPISLYAREQLLSYLEIDPAKLPVVGVGSAEALGGGRLAAPRFADGVFHLVSCSAMIEIKQLPLMIDTLAMWETGGLRWTHIGGGPDEGTVRAYADQKLRNNGRVSYDFLGVLQPEQLRGLYAAAPFDAFINTSRSEGIPVAIMEALREGIPVVAPRIGGIPELINERVGFLYPADGGADAALAALQTIARQTPEEAERMREAAQARWTERCDLGRLLPLLFPSETEEPESL